MATIALPRPIPSASQVTSSTVTTPITPPHSLQQAIGAVSSSTQNGTMSAPVPNKHIPACPTGPFKLEDPDTPPPSPKQNERQQQASLLYPPNDFTRLDSGHLSIYEIDAATVAETLGFTSNQPLPPPSLVFPWFHGLHPQNHMQQAFFNGRKRATRKSPTCLRGVTLVKADGNLKVARLKGAIAPQEFMQPTQTPDFQEPDPLDGFSVRNFQIQTIKTALTSDVVVYAEEPDEARKVAWDVAAARERWRERHATESSRLAEYNTFFCTSPFVEFEQHHEELVSIDGSGNYTGNVFDFAAQERREMWDMTLASEISLNVFLGPSPEPGTPEESCFDVLIECCDLGRLNPSTLKALAENFDQESGQSFHDFPSSGSILPPTWSHAEADGILETCKWIYHLAHGSLPATETDDASEDEDTAMFESTTPFTALKPRKILIHCADGYTESSLLAIAYFSYSTGRPVPDAWLNLHTAKHRNFFAYPSDVSLLSALAPRLLLESPLYENKALCEITALVKDEPDWFSGIDGSFPSRILDYLYLGNLGHANNPDLLRELNVTQILSVGETATWREADTEKWGAENICIIQGVQDNGIDPLTHEFQRCLDFIERGKRRGTATLVHCRVGVSRSATICIAEVMRALDLSFPRAYCFVRARRLNVIIQPHLRFAYELLRWEETLHKKGQANSASRGREMEWGEIAREIALMNRPYSR